MEYHSHKYAVVPKRWQAQQLFSSRIMPWEVIRPAGQWCCLGQKELWDPLQGSGPLELGSVPRWSLVFERNLRQNCPNMRSLGTPSWQCCQDKSLWYLGPFWVLLPVGTGMGATGRLWERCWHPQAGLEVVGTSILQGGHVLCAVKFQKLGDGLHHEELSCLFPAWLLNIMGGSHKMKFGPVIPWGEAILHGKRTLWIQGQLGLLNDWKWNPEWVAISKEVIDPLDHISHVGKRLGLI